MTTMTRRSLLLACGAAGVLPAAPAAADMVAAIEAVKPSIVIVGSYKETNNPRFTLGGTGFAVGDGHVAVTNAHVIDRIPDEVARSNLALQVRAAGGWELRRAALIDVDSVHDLALLRIEGAALPALKLHEGEPVREGQSVAFMGFPIGGALGFTVVTHRGMISAITPVALPTPSSRQLSPQAIHRLREGPFDILQLDATAYPGNSGGPLFDPESGAVLGVVNMGVVKGTKESALSHPSGISFAIPAKFIAKLLQKQRTQ